MYARVVRFTGVEPARVEEIASQTEQGEQPGPDIPAKQIRVVVDEDQSTSVAIFFFDSEEDMRRADEALNAMDSGETPGTRASVDQGEVKMSFDA